MGKQATVVLAPGFEEIEALTVVDVLRRGGVEVTVAGLGGTVIEGAHGITVQADVPLSEDMETPDALVLPGGMPGSKNLGESPLVRALACRTHDAGHVCAAICAAPAFTFAAFGLLDGKTATCYPGCEDRFPPSATFTHDRVAVDGNIVTSRGPGTALAFALKLVEMLVDVETAESLSDGMLVQ